MRRACCVAAVAFVLAAHPASVWADSEGPSLDDRWPLEAVRRPLTLPAGMASVSATLSAFRPNHLTNLDPTTGEVYQFHPSANLGVALSFGIRDRFQMSASMPRLLCMDVDAPSGCTGVNRFNGTGASARVLVVRGPHTQVAPYASISVSRSSPYVYRWGTGGTVKVAFDDTAFTISPSIARDINPPLFVPINPWLAYLPIGMNLQITQRTLIYVVVEPWGALDQLGGGVALELYGGAAYTFGRIGEIVFDAGIYNVLAEPEWNRTVPGSFALLSLVFWRQ